MRRTAFPKLRLIFYSELRHPNALLRSEVKHSGTGPRRALLQTPLICALPGGARAHPLRTRRPWRQMQNADTTSSYSRPVHPCPLRCLRARGSAPRGAPRGAGARGESCDPCWCKDPPNPPSPKACWLMSQFWVRGAIWNKGSFGWRKIILIKIA